MYAFPSGHNPKTGTQESGMTLRDYMAAKAMQAVIINSDRQSTSVESIDEWIGHYAYIVADAMLEERDK